ncbi:MAG: hypothetical protein KY445_10460 [Armatimonadetes bacterium]|nr:hypothetical protein [Armatimonadota bacterium]
MNEENPITDMAYDLMICRQALSGEVGIFEAAKTILSGHSSEDPWDKDIPDTEVLGDLVDAVEREIPQGAARQFWNPEALAQRDKLQPQIEERYREKALRAFQAIIDFWQPWVDSNPQKKKRFLFLG